MNRPVKVTSRPQLALQSYLDALLQDATEELPPEVEALPEVVEVIEVEVALDEFQAAVLEEQARDAQKPAVAAAPIVAPVVKAPVAVIEAPAPILAPVSTIAPCCKRWCRRWLKFICHPATRRHRWKPTVVRHGLPSRSSACCSTSPG